MRIVVHGQQAFGKAVLERLLERGENVVAVCCAPTKEGRPEDPLAAYAREQDLPVMTPPDIDTNGRSGDAVIVEGQLKGIGDKSRFSGFIYTPIIVGDVTTFTMTPIFDQFDAYELSGDESDSGTAIVALPLQSDFADGTRLRLGGYLRELEFEDESARDHNLYLEAMYYSKVR